VAEIHSAAWWGVFLHDLGVHPVSYFWGSFLCVLMLLYMLKNVDNLKFCKFLLQKKELYLTSNGNVNN
jgi:hypothetical protein